MKIKENIPNILTIFRLVLIPLFVYLFFSELPNNMTLAFMVFFIAGITDVLDGYIARRYNLVTDIGKVLDPLADKVMLICVLICLASTNLVPLWVLVIMMLKELVMVYGGVYLYFYKVQIIIPSNKYGKIGTVLFYIAICFVLLNVDPLFTQIALYVAVLIAVVAFLTYLRIALQTKKEKNVNN